jgi:SAM-dependent methyltransferase
MTTDAACYEQEGWGDERPLDPAIYAARLAGTRALVPAAPARWLDVGSGDGRFLDDLVTAAGADPGRVTSAERSWSALRHNPHRVLQASGDGLPFPDGAFDVVSAFEVIEHLPVGIFEATLAELARVSRDVVVITVPNQERTARANVRCPVCACEFNPNRHLRSFHPERLEGLVPGFRVEQVAEFGHRAYVYPRTLRRGLERIGLFERPGWPVCPQCGHQWHERPPAVGAPDTAAARDAPAPETTATDTTGTSTTGTASVRHRIARAGYRLARTVAPRARHPYFLGARFRRV